MAAKRCAGCGIIYPPHLVACHLCQGRLDPLPYGQADADWQETVNRRQWDQLCSDEEGGKVRDWRKAELERAGYDAEAARLIAHADDVDLHQALWIHAHGCDVETALRILL